MVPDIKFTKMRTETFLIAAKEPFNFVNLLPLFYFYFLTVWQTTIVVILVVHVVQCESPHSVNTLKRTVMDSYLQ